MPMANEKCRGRSPRRRARGIAAFAIALLGAALLAGCAATGPVQRPVQAAPAATSGVPAAPQAASTSIVPASYSRPATDLRLPKTIAPSNRRNWRPDLAVLPIAEFDGELVTVRNVRNCRYLSADEYVLNDYDKTYDLARLRTVDFIMVPFKNMPAIAHTMLSFGFEEGDQLVVSVEVRKEQGEKYESLKGFFRNYELIYVIADERDSVQLSANVLKDDVFMYRGRATPEQARALLVDILHRTNKLAVEPEFYHTLSNNCTTNLARHVNSVTPGRIPFSLGVLLPGLSDRLAYDLGLLDTRLSYAEARRAAHLGSRALEADGRADYSEVIRR
jgi:hypothetical protein